MNKNGARRKNARTAHMHEALCAVVAAADAKKERCCCCRSMAHLRSGWRADAVVAADATPKSPVFGPARGRSGDGKIYAACIYITSISRMILYINSTSANICPALMNCMDFLIPSLSCCSWKQSKGTCRWNWFGKLGACVSVIWTAAYLFI